MHFNDMGHVMDSSFAKLQYLPQSYFAAFEFLFYTVRMQ